LESCDMGMTIADEELPRERVSCAVNRESKRVSKLLVYDEAELQRIVARWINEGRSRAWWFVGLMRSVWVEGVVGEEVVVE